jgi:hypothetical protein
MSAKSGDTAPCRRLRIMQRKRRPTSKVDSKSVAGETRRARLEIGDFPFAPRSSPPRPSPGSRRCPAAGQRAPWRGPRLGRHRPPAPGSSSPLLDARGYRGDLGIRVGPCIFGIWDQPLDRPPLDPIGRPRSLIPMASRARARARADGREVLGTVTPYCSRAHHRCRECIDRDAASSGDRQLGAVRGRSFCRQEPAGVDPNPTFTTSPVGDRVAQRAA